MKRTIYVVLSILLATNLLGMIVFLADAGWRYETGWIPFFVHLVFAGFSLALIYIVFLLAELHCKIDDLKKVSRP